MRQRIEKQGTVTHLVGLRFKKRNTILKPVLTELITKNVYLTDLINHNGSFVNLKFRMANPELENLHLTFNNFAFELDERQIPLIEGNYKMITSL